MLLLNQLFKNKKLFSIYETLGSTPPLSIAPLKQKPYYAAY